MSFINILENIKAGWYHDNTMFNLKSIKLSGTFLFILSLLVFFVPLIHVSNTNELYEFPKMIAVYILGTTFIFLYLAFYLWRQKSIYFPALLPTFFVGVYFLATAFSSHIYTSVWGYFTRFNGGLISVLILFGVYFVTLNIFGDKKPDSGFVIKVALLSLLPVSIIGIGQYWQDVTRVYSTLGQPNWLAAYISMLLPGVLYYGLTSPTLSVKRVFWSGLFFIGYVCLWFTYSISGILGLIGSLAVFTILNFEKVRLNIKYLLLLFIVLTGFSVFNLGVYKERFEDVVTDINRVSSSLLKAYAQLPNQLHSDQPQYNISDPGFIRTGLWKGTVNLILSSPKIFLVGSGPETFPYVFPKYRVSSLNYSSEWDFILNKPHNYYLELFSQMGVFGFIFYLLIVLWVLKKRHPVFTPGLCALFITNIFSWPTVTTHLLFWMFIAFIQLDSKKSVKVFSLPESLGGNMIRVNNLSNNLSSKLKYLGIILFPLYLLILTKFINIYQADVYAASAEKLVNSGKILESLDMSNKAVSENPHEPLYYRRRAKVLLAAATGMSGENLLLLKNKALEDLNTAYTLNPNNLATLRNSVPLYYFLAVNDLSKSANTAEPDPRFLPYAENYMQRLKSISNSDVGIFVLTAKYENRLGLTDALEDSLNKIRELRPDLLEWHESLREIDVSLRNPAF